MKSFYSLQDKVVHTLKINQEWTETEKRAYWLGIDDAMFEFYGKEWLSISLNIFKIIMGIEK